MADALTPQRTQGSLRYSREDAARFAALGDAVRAHVSAAYASAVDQRCLTDTTSGLLSITEPNDPGAVTDFDGYISAWVGKLDGQYAGEPGDVRMILGAATVAHMVGQYKTNTSPTSAYRAVLDLAGNAGLRVANGIPAADANDQAAFRAPLVLSFTDAGELVGQRPQRPGLVEKRPFQGLWCWSNSGHFGVGPWGGVFQLRSMVISFRGGT